MKRKGDSGLKVGSRPTSTARVQNLRRNSQKTIESSGSEKPRAEFI